MGCGQSDEKLKGFPTGFKLDQLEFKTWAEQTKIGKVWFAQPKTRQNAVDVCNWAAKNGYTVRPSGHRTAWSPITYTQDTADEPKSICLDTSLLCAVTVDKADSTAVVEAGCKQWDLMQALDKEGLAMAQYPGYGSLTIGGCIATGSHGWSAPSEDPSKDTPGAVHGSVANSVLEVTCVVSDDKGVYGLKTFKRDDPEGRAMIVAFGNNLLIDIKIRAIPQFNLRVVSCFDWDFALMFRKPEEAGVAPEGSLQEVFNKCGRVSAIWIPYTETVWTRYMENAPEKPESSREVTEPYAYTFQNVGEEPWQTSAIEGILGNPAETTTQRLAEAVEKPFTKGTPGPLTAAADGWADLCNELGDALGTNKILHRATEPYQKMSAKAMIMGNDQYNTGDLWGKSVNLLHYVTDGIRIASHGIIVHLNRKHMQTAAHVSANIFRDVLYEFRKEDKWPLVMPVEYRVGSLDDPTFANTTGSPSASFLYYGEKAKANGWDIALYIDLVYLPNTPTFPEYAAEIMKRHEAAPELSGDNALIMCEWSKAFASTKEGHWRDEEALKRFRSRLPEWDAAVDTWKKYDSKRLYTNDWLKKFVVKN